MSPATQIDHQTARINDPGRGTKKELTQDRFPDPACRPTLATARCSAASSELSRPCRFPTTCKVFWGHPLPRAQRTLRAGLPQRLEQERGQPLGRDRGVGHAHHGLRRGALREERHWECRDELLLPRWAADCTKARRCGILFA